MARAAIVAYPVAVGWSSCPDQTERTGSLRRRGWSGGGEDGDERRDEKCAAAGHTEAEKG